MHRLLAAIVTSLCFTTPAISQGLPTTDDIRTLYEQGNYPRALQQLSRALAVKGKAAKDYDRYELLVLKAETHLRMENSSAAVTAFDEAAVVARDDKAAVLARAMAALVRRSKNLIYTPPATKGQAAPDSIDVTDKTRRTAAFASMYNDARPRVEAQVKLADQSGELPAILDVLRSLRDLRDLEVAATDNDAASSRLAKGLTGKARSLMARAVAEMADTGASIEEVASRVYEDVRPAKGSSYITGSGYVGLNTSDANTLRQIAADCARIARIAGDLISTFGSDEADALRTLRDDAEAVATKAREVVIAYGRRRHSHALGASPSGSGIGGVNMPGGQLPDGWRRPGTIQVQRPPKKGNPDAGPRGVGTGGPSTR